MAKSKKKRSSKTVNTQPTTIPTPAKPKSKADQFRVEYAYVIRDLRTVFILAGVMFVVLIVLNLILQS